MRALSQNARQGSDKAVDTIVVEEERPDRCLAWSTWFVSLRASDWEGVGRRCRDVRGTEPNLLNCRENNTPRWHSRCHKVEFKIEVWKKDEPSRSSAKCVGQAQRWRWRFPSTHSSAGCIPVRRVQPTSAPHEPLSNQQYLHGPERAFARRLRKCETWFEGIGLKKYKQWRHLNWTSSDRQWFLYHMKE